MKSLIKNVMLLSLYHVAKETVSHIEEALNKDDHDEKQYKRKMLVVGMIHTLLGSLYDHE